MNANHTAVVGKQPSYSNESAPGGLQTGPECSINLTKICLGLSGMFSIRRFELTLKNTQIAVIVIYPSKS